jgi:hypothetical protein
MAWPVKAMIQITASREVTRPGWTAMARRPQPEHAP